VTESSTSPDPSAYYSALQAEDERLQAVLAAIRNDEESGSLTTREAADARIGALEAHLENCQAARRRHLGSDSEVNFKLTSGQSEVDLAGPDTGDLA
jgi:hypothetical protein